jgi:hypothetical protein
MEQRMADEKTATAGQKTEKSQCVQKKRLSKDAIKKRLARIREAQAAAARQRLVFVDGRFVLRRK